MKNLNIEFEAVVEIESNIAYASSSLFNALCEVNLITGECEYINMFPNEEVSKRRLHAKAVKSGNKIYFIPAAAENLTIYDISAKCFEIVKIKPVDKKKYPFFSEKYKFSNGVVWKRYIFLISATYPAIIRLDSESGEMKYFENWIPKTSYFFRNGVSTAEGKYYTPSVKNNLVLEFDFETCVGKRHYIGRGNNGSWGICKSGKDMWLSPKREGVITRWNYETNEIQEYVCFPKGFKGIDFLFNKIFESQGKIIAIPTKANMAIMITDRESYVQYCDVVEMQEGDMLAFLFELGDCYYLKRTSSMNCNNKNVEYIKLNVLTLSSQVIQFNFREGKDRLEKEFFEVINSQKYSNVLYENESIGLLEIITNIEDRREKQVKQENEIGKGILQEIENEHDS